MEKRVQEALKVLKTELTEMYGNRFRGLYLYGSYARGEERNSSDIDVAMVLDDFKTAWPEIGRTSELVSGLTLDLEITVSLIPVREKAFAERSTLLTRSIAREGIAV